jgi:hypothetical protein
VCALPNYRFAWKWHLSGRPRVLDERTTGGVLGRTLGDIPGFGHQGADARARFRLFWLRLILGSIEYNDETFGRLLRKARGARPLSSPRESSAMELALTAAGLLR